MVRTPSRDLDDALITAAEQILTDEGPAGLTVRKVASCAGVAPMGVYNRFDGKNGLLEALFSKAFDALTDEMLASSGSDAVERLRDAAMRYRRFALGHPEHYRLMFEQMHDVKPGTQALERAFASFGQLVAMVAAARELVPLGRGSDIDVAQQWWGALHGAVGLELLGIRFDEDAEASFVSLIDALLAGFRAQAAESAAADTPTTQG